VFYVTPQRKLLSNISYNTNNERLFIFRRERKKYKSLAHQNLIAITALNYGTIFIIFCKPKRLEAYQKLK
jgi:hypothetical protein